MYPFRGRYSNKEMVEILQLFGLQLDHKTIWRGFITLVLNLNFREKSKCFSEFCSSNVSEAGNFKVCTLIPKTIEISL